MTYEIYRYIFIGGAILSVVMLIVTMILFFVLHIPKIVGELTGSSEKKAVEYIRSRNASKSDKLNKSSSANRERSEITDKITASGRLCPGRSSYTSFMTETSKINTQQLIPEPYSDSETTLLFGASMAKGNQLNEVGNELTSYETNCRFIIEKEISFVHTEEIIT